MSESRSLEPGPVGRVLVQRSRISPLFTLAGVLVIVVFFSSAPWLLPAANVSTLMNFFILVIMATMWNLLAGYAGMVSIGQQGFVGLGAYATLYFAIKGINPFVAIPLAIIACGVIAVPVTYLIFRLRGGYFSVATWVIADSAMLLIGSVALLGGGTGHFLPGLSNLSPTQLNHDTYLATWIVALVVVVATYFLLIEEHYGVRPPYGFVVLGNGVRKRIKNTEELREKVLRIAAEIREARLRVEEEIRVSPQKWQCRVCGSRSSCRQSRA